MAPIKREITLKSLKQLFSFFTLPANHPWQAYWLAETVRLQEADTGRFDDSLINQKIAVAKLEFEPALVKRADLLAQRLGYKQQQAVVLAWYHRLVILMLIVALFAGGSTSLAFLAENNEKINLLWALLLLLGLNTVAMVVWVFAVLLSRRAVKGEWLLLLLQRLGGKRSAPLLQGLVSFLQRQGAVSWLFSVVTHLLWLSFMSGVFLGLGLKLLAQDYGFYWGSTLLFSDHIVPTVIALGRPATWLGFAVPDADLIRATGELTQYSEIARYQWGTWLLWVVFFLGWLPRAGLMLFAMLKLWQLREPKQLPLPPEWLPLREQLAPAVATITDPRGAGAQMSQVFSNQQAAGSHGQKIWLGYELASSLQKQLQVNGAVRAFPQVDGRAQQVEVLAYMATLPSGVKKLMLVCDARLTPDRGLQRFVQELKMHCQNIGLLLLVEHEEPAIEQIMMWQGVAERLCLQWLETSQWIDGEE